MEILVGYLVWVGEDERVASTAISDETKGALEVGFTGASVEDRGDEGDTAMGFWWRGVGEERVVQWLRWAWGSRLWLEDDAKGGHFGFPAGSQEMRRRGEESDGLVRLFGWYYTIGEKGSRQWGLKVMVERR